LFPDLAAAAAVPCFGDAVVVGGPNQRWFRGFEGDPQREEAVLDAAEQVQAGGLSPALLDGGDEEEGKQQEPGSVDAPSTPQRNISADTPSPIRTPRTPTFQLGVHNDFFLGSEDDDDEDGHDENAALKDLL
jgi:hypothetical protein